MERFQLQQNFNRGLCRGLGWDPYCLVFLNGVKKEIKMEREKFVDNRKLFNSVKTVVDYEELQSDFKKLGE